ncbi:uncharacterized protein V6R79_019737 [Siganus canaliculatus]
MHGLPCSSLGTCFGNPTDVNTEPAPTQEPDTSIHNRNNQGLPAAGPVISQPGALSGCLQQQQQHKQPQRTVSSISTHSTGTAKINGTNSKSMCHLQDPGDSICFGSSPLHSNISQSSEDDEMDLDCSLGMELKYPQIPRPSIIIRQPQESEFQETASDRSDGRETENGRLSAFTEDKKGEIMMHQGLMSVQNLLCFSVKHTQTLSHVHNCHTDLDFLWSRCVHVVGRAFLLSVLEILLIQLIHTKTQADRQTSDQTEGGTDT